VTEARGFINAGKVDEKHEPFEVLQIWKDAHLGFGNHTYLHEDLNKVSAEDFERSIGRNEPMLTKLGVGDDRFFRYPYLREGDTLEKRNAIRGYLREQSYKIAQVTVDFEDWSWNEPYVRCKAKGDAKKIAWLKKTYLENAVETLKRADKISRGLFKRQVPQILLLHIGALDAEMIDSLLTEYEEVGVTYISLGDALRDEMYAINPNIAAQYGSEITYQIMRSRGVKLKQVGLEPYTGYPEKELESACR
jgi:hypothetical protein